MKKTVFIIAIGLIVGIIVLILVFIPKSRRIYGPSNNLKCQSNLRALYMVMIEYKSQFHSYPSGKGAAFWEALRNYPTVPESILTDKKNDLYICPFTNHKPVLGICDYLGPNFQVIADKFDETTPLAADQENNHPDGNVNVLYFGGGIVGMDKNSEEWKRVSKMLSK
jgi:hypothetical protein